MVKNNRAKLTWQNVVDRSVYYGRQLFRQATPSPFAGMGAIPQHDGITFRLWAPHAGKVFVTGTFNDWSYWRTPLAQ